MALFDCSQTEFIEITLDFLLDQLRQTHLIFRHQKRDKQLTPRGY